MGRKIADFSLPSYLELNLYKEIRLQIHSPNLGKIDDMLIICPKIDSCSTNDFLPLSGNIAVLNEKPIDCGQPECRVSGDIIPKTNYHPAGDILRVPAKYHTYENLRYLISVLSIVPPKKRPKLIN